MKEKIIPLSKISSLPSSPGVYIFYGKRNSRLYIGKAVNLKERVKSHFKTPSYKDNLFIDEVKKIGFIELPSEIEALFVESQLIKKLKPKFNVLFRDDKNYFFVGFTKEDWPRVFLTHQTKLKDKKIKKAEFVGPFVEGTAIKKALKILRKIFPFRSCKTLPKKPCLFYQLSRCPGVCIFERELKEKPQLKKQIEKRKKEYKRDIRSLKLILKGKRKKLLEDLKKEMEKLAKKEEFERAAKIRDQIQSLEEIFSHKTLLLSPSSLLQIEREKEKNIGEILMKNLKLKNIPKKIEAFDVSNIGEKEMVGSMVTFELKNENEYRPKKEGYRRFKIKTVKKQNDIACLKEIIKRRFHHPEWEFPDLLFVDGGKAQLNTAKKTLDELKIEIPIISLAKKRGLVFTSYSEKPLSLDKFENQAKMVILNLSREAHRFAISYHRLLRKKRLFSEK